MNWIGIQGSYTVTTLIWCPIFDSSPLIQNSKFNSFLWVCWFLCKNLSNFVPPAWKLHNPYCHIHRYATVEQAVKALKIDILRTFQARLEMHCDNLFGDEIQVCQISVSLMSWDRWWVELVVYYKIQSFCLICRK